MFICQCSAILKVYSAILSESQNVCIPNIFECVLCEWNIYRKFEGNLNDNK